MKPAMMHFAILVVILFVGCSVDSGPGVEIDGAAREDGGSEDGAVVRDGGTDGDTNDAGRTDQVETYLSDWAWLYENVGESGSAERDTSINTPRHGDGNPIRLQGTGYDKGIGVAGPSDVRFNLDARCSRFRSVVGIDDEVIQGGAQVEVWADGARLFQSGGLTHTSEPEEIDVDVTGVYELRLLVYAFNDHVDWADARVMCDEGWRGDAISSYASDWVWDAMSNGVGPVERDGSNGSTEEDDGTVITLGGRSFEKGVGMHAPSEVEIDLDGNCRRFRSVIGVDDDVTDGGSVVFLVWADDELLYESEAMTSASANETVNVDLVGRSRLRLLVSDAGDGSTGDVGSWGDARLLCRSGWTGEQVDTYVSDWVMTLAKNGYGPVERDVTNGNLFAYDGRPLTIDGTTYERGLGTHANSEIRISLAGRCDRFRADVGIDDDSRAGGVSSGSVTFEVLADGVPLFTSPVKNQGDAPTSIDVNVVARGELQLIVDSGGDDMAWDHSDWANARLSCDIGALGL